VEESAWASGNASTLPGKVVADRACLVDAIADLRQGVAHGQLRFASR
jgi:hypothetical protein